MKYKIGDKVRVKSIEWYNENKDEHGYVNPPRGYCMKFNHDMSKYCEKVCIISDCLIGGAYYRIKEDGAKSCWFDWMFEEICKEEVEKEEIEETSDDGLNLCEILKGCEGTKIYCALTGEYVEVVKVDSEEESRPIYVKDKNCQVWSYPKEGYRYDDYPNGECMLFPSKECRDWDRFEKPIPVDTPMMCCLGDSSWSLRYYSHKKGNRHFVFASGYQSRDKQTTMDYTFVIPYDKFNPNDEGGSLIYNIQK